MTHATSLLAKTANDILDSSYRSGPHAHSFKASAVSVADVRAARVHREAVLQVRELDRRHSQQAGGAAYVPGARRAGSLGLRGPVLRAFEESVGTADGGQVHGLVW